MQLVKNQMVTVLKNFRDSQGKEVKGGKSYKVYMGSDVKAAALLIELTKAGKEKSIMNMNNIIAMHESRIEQAISGGYIQIERGL